MRLKDVAQVRTDFVGADFWLTRRGGIESVGEPSRTFSSYHIGVRVEATGLILPDYLYYVFVHLHQAGRWQPLAVGSLSLVNIRTEDVRNIALLMN